MSVTEVGAGGTMSLVDFLQQPQQETSSILDSSTALSTSNRLLSTKNSYTRNGYGEESGSGLSLGQAALSRALSEMNSGGGKVTFADIAAYREQLEQEFTLLMRASLVQKGVSLETEFLLVMDANGNVDVSCDDPVAKETIRAFLAENPQACNQFGYIQALANLERARNSPAGASAAWSEFGSSKKAYQAQAVEAFFSDALDSGMNYSSLLASFGVAANEDSASARFYAGLSYTV